MAEGLWLELVDDEEQMLSPVNWKLFLFSEVQ